MLPAYYTCYAIFPQELTAILHSYGISEENNSNVFNKYKSMHPKLKMFSADLWRLTLEKQGYRKNGYDKAKN